MRYSEKSFTVGPKSKKETDNYRKNWEKAFKKEAAKDKAAERAEGKKKRKPKAPAKVKKVKVTVTAEDIKKGRRCSYNSCPIALAIKRAYRIKNVRVDYGILFFGDEMQFPLPQKAQNFIQHFDEQMRQAKPFSFMLDNIPE